MKIVCKETFEKGLPRAEGGMFKMVKGYSYDGQVQKDGAVLLDTQAGAKRTISRSVLDELVKLKLIEIKDDASAK